MLHKSVLKQTRHLPILTLQEMSLIKIITTLCNNRQLLGLILKCILQPDLPFRLCARNGKEWKAVEAMATEKILQICNCVLLKKRLLELLWPVSYRIMLWNSVYAPSISKTFLQHFYWTDRGRIDNTRTIRCIIENKNISARKRFVLACSVCLGNEIREIWREMSNDDKAYFYAEYRDKISPLILFWAHTLEGSDNVLEQYMEDALRCASEIGLLEAVKYLFAISPENEKIFMASLCMDELIIKLKSEFLLEEDENDIGYFVFFEMSDKNQEGFFKCFPETVLSLLLHSSKYKLCLNLLEERLESASKRDIVRALYIIFYTYHLEVVNDDDCQMLFIDVWRKIPTSMKNTTILRDLRSEFLCVLIRDHFPFLLEKEAFKNFAELTSLDLKCNTSHKQVDFHQDKWNFLHFLIEEVITIPLMQMNKKVILFLLRKGQSNKAAWNRMLRFVRKVRSKNPNRKE